MVDVNGDGFPDIVATRAISNYEQHVFLNDGTGRFTRASLPGLPQDGLHVVLSGGIGQPTRIANVQFRYRNGEAKPTPCTLAVQTYEMAAVPIPATISVVEYYNASLDHYFVTPLAAEQANLDAGLTPTRWVRTGKAFNAFESAAARSSPVCRFYIPPALGDSHFFGRGTTECASTAAKNPSFVLESPAFMHLTLPGAGPARPARHPCIGSSATVPTPITATPPTARRAIKWSAKAGLRRATAPTSSSCGERTR
ncbi:MAG: VCBS repeat-containing protein [Betaproteobacteria bacterium]|nr:VCBS repeat-containing protein [Betaproteobacteria bacterium]